MLLRSPYRYLLAAAVLAAMLCLLPARGADAPVQTEKSLELTARQSDAPRKNPPEPICRIGHRRMLICIRRCIMRRAVIAFSVGKNCRKARRADTRRAGKRNRKCSARCGGHRIFCRRGGCHPAQGDSLSAALGFARRGRWDALRFAESGWGNDERHSADGYPRDGGSGKRTERPARRADV